MFNVIEKDYKVQHTRRDITQFCPHNLQWAEEQYHSEHPEIAFVNFKEEMHTFEEYSTCILNFGYSGSYATVAVSASHVVEGHTNNPVNTMYTDKL